MPGSRIGVRDDAVLRWLFIIFLLSPSLMPPLKLWRTNCWGDGISAFRRPGKSRDPGS